MKFEELNPQKAKVPAQFSDAYPDALFKVITPDNVEEYLL